MVKEVALIGRRHTAMPYKMLGFNVHYCLDISEARQELLDCMASNKYAIIYVEDIFYNELSDILEEQVESVVPAIIMIPSIDGDEEDAANRIAGMVETAIGMKIV